MGLTVQAVQGNSDEYTIDDADFQHRIYLAKSWLQNPLFNLVYWYKEYIYRYGWFETCYLRWRFTHPDDRPESWENIAVGDGSESWEGVELENDPAMPELVPVDDDDDADRPELVAVEDDDDPDMPELVIVDDEDDLESTPEVVPARMAGDPGPAAPSDSSVVERVHTVLVKCQPFPRDEIVRDPSYPPGGAQFLISLQEFGLVEIYD